MSTTIAPVNAKINTIQPIEGAKGNIALFYYQGKYPIYKSLDDNMYHLKSVMDAYKASTDKDISKNLINDWVKLKKTQELVSYFFETGIPVSKVLIQKRQQRPQNRYLDGWYANEEVMIDFAGWLNMGFRVEIYRCFAMSAERDRLNADINHKQSTIDELKQDIARIKGQNDELLSVNRKMCNQLETIKVTLSTLVENVSELKNHVTSNKLCRYIIVLYRDDEHSDSEFVVIKPFCGLKENRPKIDQSTILFEREVSCSIDSFKETLSVLEERYIVKIHYRSITIRRYRLEEFVDEFKVELRRKTANINDVCDKITALNDNIVTLNTNVADIAKRLSRYQPFVDAYKVPWEMVESIGKSELMYPYKGDRYEVHLRTATQIPFIKIGGKIRVISISDFRKAFL